MSNPYKVHASSRFKELERPQITERLDFGEIVRRQIDRCLMSAGDEVAFASHVKALEALIPVSNVTKEYLEELEGCSETFEYTTPMTCCGVAIRDDVLEAKKEEVVEVDWSGRFQAAVNLFSSMGLTWRRTLAT